MTVIILDFCGDKKNPPFPSTRSPLTATRSVAQPASPSVASTSRCRNFSPVQPPCSCHWLQDPKMQSLGLGGHLFGEKSPGKKWWEIHEKSQSDNLRHTPKITLEWTTNWTHGLFGGSQKSLVGAWCGLSLSFGLAGSALLQICDIQGKKKPRNGCCETGAIWVATGFFP